MANALNHLICFVGSRDPRPDFGVAGPTGAAEDGPVLALLGHREFDEVYLLCSSDAYFERATQIRIECDENEGMPRVILVPVDVPDVIDYTGIYRTLLAATATIRARSSHREVKWWVLLDPGTPQMQTAWILLVRSGAFPAGLLQGVPPRFNNGVYTCREVDLSDAALPSILPPVGAGPDIDFDQALLSVTPYPQTSLEGRPASSESAAAITRRLEAIATRVATSADSTPEWDPRFLALLEQSGLTVRDRSTLEVFHQAWIVAQHDHIHHLILGETGTGKSELARWIHRCGPRRDGPFQTLNCATLAGDSSGSTLFGHRKGAYTGADWERPGFLRSAEGGVLFLDEIGDLSLEVQARLLHVLDDGTFYPLGTDQALKADVVVVAATNRDLKSMEEQGKFRQDLFSRLSTVPLTMPPLRERPDDLRSLLNRKVDDWNRVKMRRLSLSDGALNILLSYLWPKNIRELEQVVTRICLFAEGDTIDPEDLPEEILQSVGAAASPRIRSFILPENGIRLPEYLVELERDCFRQAIERTGGVLSHAAALLGYKPGTFRKAIRERYPELDLR